MSDLSDVRGIGSAYEEALRAGGITDLADLRGVDPDAASDRTGLSELRIERWRAMARLLEVEEVGPRFAEALERLGVTDLEALADADAGALAGDLADLARDGVAPERPTVEAVRAWQDRAGDLVLERDERPEAETIAPDEGAPEPLDERYDLTDVLGIGPAYRDALNAGGITTLADLRTADIDEASRRTGLPAPFIERWGAMADFLRVEGVDPQFAEGLVELGKTDLAALSEGDPDDLAAGLARLQRDGTIPERPTVAAVKQWQERAARIVTAEREQAVAEEVKLATEVMPCRAMRHYYDPPDHPCRWFSNWGPFHSFDVPEGETEPEGDGLMAAVYAGRRDPVPEILSGCRKAPIMSVGLNPNLRAATDPTRILPYFDDLQQYARHFRFRTTFKYSLEDGFYEEYADEGFERGQRVPLEKEYVSMYREYADILESFKERAGLGDSDLALGEDVSYMNFVACHSPAWDADGETEAGIVEECFRDRQYFVRQFVQSRPKVVVVFAKDVMERFVSYFEDAFVGGPPDPDEPYRELLDRNDFWMRLVGTLVRVVFAPHPTGFAPWYIRLEGKRRIAQALYEEYERGSLRYDEDLGHLVRPSGDCTFCDNDQFFIEPCRYEGHFEAEDRRTVAQRSRDERRLAEQLIEGGDQPG